MAYFAQAGSGQSHSHNDSRNEGASDPFGQGSRTPNAASSNAPGPKVTINPHVTVTPPTAMRSAPVAQAAAAQSTRSPSPFPVEGPDLYANYQPRQSEQEAETAAIGFGAVPPVTVPPVEVPQQQPKLQDYVSEDYGVPGIGAQDYGAQDYNAQSFSAPGYEDAQAAQEPYAAAGYGEQTYEPEATDATYGAHYGGAAAQNYGYAPQEDAPDYGYDDDSSFATPVAASGLARISGLAGAAASLALVVGLGVWGYQLVMRDVSGVPVVRAIEGPMRAQPENPGGSQADHQGLAVNSVAANGTAEAPAERLTLAPQPIQLAQDDQPMSRLIRPEADVPPQVLNKSNETASPQVSDASVAAYRSGDIDALVAELTDGVTPLDQGQETAADGGAAAPSIVQPEPLKPVEIAAIVSTSAPSSALRNAPGIKISLRPNLRPARFSPAVAQTATSTRATLEVDPKTLPAGTRLAQLGAYESAAVARAEWDRIYSRFEDYLEGKTRVIQRAESGGRTFYRLRAMGFQELSDARRFCSTLVAGKADCIPVTTR